MAFRYFDLHLHPVFKTLFKEKQISGWENIEVPDGIFGNCFDSQSSLRMLLNKGNVNLVCVGKHAPEKGMVYNIGTRLASRIRGYHKFLERPRLKKMTDSITDYQEIHAEEKYHLLDEPIPTDQRCFRVKPLTPDMKKYDPADFNTLHVVFNVEGAHMFYEKDNVCTNLDKMIEKFNDYTKEHHLLYVTVAHLTPNVFSNHADGNKILPNENTWPSGRGILPFGEPLIKEIYNKNVLVDIKHMSWVARKDLYSLRKKNKWEDKPLIASHAALTGFKFSERLTYIRKTGGFKDGGKVIKIRYNKKQGLIENTYFNPNSINLYDEDVFEILKSKGLIGINIDKRILGASEEMISGNIKTKEAEFISCEESGDWIGDISPQSPRFDVAYKMVGKKKVRPELDDEDEEEADNEFYELFPAMQKGKSKSRKRKVDLHLKYFCNQLLKIKQIADEHPVELRGQGIEAWDHICIGSDFDGLISTVHCCSDVTKVEEFAKMIKQNLQAYAKEAKIDLGVDKSGRNIVNVIVDKLFFENGYNFLKEHFK